MLNVACIDSSSIHSFYHYTQVLYAAYIAFFIPRLSKTLHRFIFYTQVEQDLASPATNISVAGSLEEVMRLCKMPSTLDKDKVGVRTRLCVRAHACVCMCVSLCV